MIPDGQGHWKNTDPRKDRMRVTEVNQSYGGNALPLIRLMKYWKKRAWGESVSSYMFEQLMLNCISEGHAVGDSWSKRATSVLGYLKYAILNPVPDPKGIQGDLNTLDYLARIDLANTARHNHSTAVLARADEALDKPQEAIEKWRSIFGYSFPGYGYD